MLKATHRLLALSLVFLFVSSPLIAQQRRGIAAPRKPATPAAPEPVPTFDTLLSADSYKVYCEVRGVGGLIRSSAVNDLLDPVMKLGGPPKEFKTLVKWLNAHAEVLAGSRLLVAGWPSRPALPDVIVAIEFSSAEEAKKFYPELRDFLPKLLPTPTPASSPTPESPALVSPGAAAVQPTGQEAKLTATIVPPASPQELRAVPEKENEPAPPPYQMKQAGSMILISSTEFKLRSLHPRDSKPLAEDQNFLLARNRFSNESIFLYVDVKSIEREDIEQRKKYEEEDQRLREKEAAAIVLKAEEAPINVEPAAPTATMEELSPPPDPASLPDRVVVPDPDSPATGNATLSAEPARGVDEVSPMMFSLYGALFGGESKWPEAVAAALVFEGDAYVVRTLILNQAENKGTSIPFVPAFVSGLALVPESPNVFPADTDLFASVSLDYPQVYEGMLKTMVAAEEQSRKYRSKGAPEIPPRESPFAAYEKKLGLKVKDDILPLLGNEIALALSKKPRLNPSLPKNDVSTPAAQSSGPLNRETKTTKDAEPNVVIAIAVKDREAVGRLIPKIIEALGFKGANFLAQTEKHDGAEITSYGDMFSYAFVGDFLIVSPDPLATRKVVDAYLNHETLSSSSHFKNFTRWQPRQVLGQVYVAPGLVEQFTAGMGGPLATPNDKVGEYLSRLSPTIDPLTYSLTNDGQGPLHELHVPKNLLQLIIAGASAESAAEPLENNERAASSLLRTVHSAEATFQATEGAGRYGTLDELVSASLLSKESIENYGYKIEVSAAGSKFEATAVPLNYGATGRLSYFIDESGVLRGGAHGGGAASVADSPLR
jgi:hypothetical protein